MKTLKLIFLSLFCLTFAVAQTTDKDGLILNVTETEKGNVWTVDVYFSNPVSDNYTAFQVDFRISSGFAVTENSLEADTRLLAHTLEGGMRPGKVFRVVGYSMSNAEIAGRSGKLFSFQYHRTGDVKENTYEVKSYNTRFVKRDGEEVHLPDVKEHFDYLIPAGTHQVVYVIDGKDYWRMNLVKGTRVPALLAPEKEGHTFAGWKGVPELMPENDVTVTAEYIVNTYTITYYLNGEKYGVQECKYGETIVPLEVKGSAAETFSGWEGLPEKMPAKNLTVYGKSESTGIEELEATTYVEVYTLQGVRVLSEVTWDEAKHQLPAGIYIVNGMKCWVK